MSTRNGDMDIQMGLVGGAVAWIVGFVVTFLLAVLGVIEGPMGMDISSDIDLVLAVFNEWHLANTVLDYMVVTSLMWVIVPIVLLLIAGYLVASQNLGGAMAGASIVAGYLLMVILSIVYMFLQGDPEMDLVIVHLILGGIVLPAVFGGIGGFIAEEV